MIAPTHLIAPIALTLFAVAAYRLFWAERELAKFGIKAGFFAHIFLLDAQDVADLNELWPRGYLMWDILHWNLRHYAVNLHLYDEMEVCVRAGMSIPLTMEQLFPEPVPAVAASSPAVAPSVPSPAADIAAAPTSPDLPPADSPPTDTPAP